MPGAGKLKKSMTNTGERETRSRSRYWRRVAAGIIGLGMAAALVFRPKSNRQPTNYDLDLEEYRQLRTEIHNRQTMSSWLTIYVLAAFGAGAAAAAAQPTLMVHNSEILLGPALATTCFWLLWIDHSVQTFKIAYYVTIRLVPRLQERSPGVTHWEKFIRKFDTGTLPKTEQLWWARRNRTRASMTYTAIFLGGSALAFILIHLFFVLGQPNSVQEVLQKWYPCYQSLIQVKLIALGVTVAVWLYAAYRAICMSMLIRGINKSICSHAGLMVNVR
jgi:hypothetical protein